MRRARLGYARTARGVFFRLSLLLAATAFALAAAELGWRSLRAHGWRAASPFGVVADPLLGWRFAAGTYRHRTADFDVVVDLDGDGCRVGPGSVRPARVAAVARRAAEPGSPPLVVFVGDSLTFGWGVATGATFVDRVAQALPVRSRSLAVAGYRLDQSLLRLERDGLPLRPQLVVYTWCDNDLPEILLARAYTRRKPRFRLDGAALVLAPPSAPPWSWRDLELAASAEALLAPPHVELDPAAAAAARRLAGALLARMAADVEPAGARLVVVHPGTAWLAAALPANTLAVDVGASLAVAERGAPIRFAHDPHWNARGHEVVARAIVERLRRSGVVQTGS